MTTEKKMIRIIDGQYNLLFTVEDGGYISVDGKPYQLEYLDETHFRAVGGRCFHICEFGEKVVDKGQVVKKVENQVTAKKYSWLAGLEASIDFEDSRVTVRYDASLGFGTLQDCDYRSVRFEAPDLPIDLWNSDYHSVRFEAPATIEDGTIIRYKISDHAELMVKVLDAEEGVGLADYVITLDREALGDNIYVCPACGERGLFQAFPPTEFDMAADGTMTIPEGMAVDPSFENDIEVRCKACSFVGTKNSFDTSSWDEAERT